MILLNRLLLGASLLAALPAYAGDCLCFHYTADKDGVEQLEGSHETDCGTHTHTSSVSKYGPTFEPKVLDRILHNVGGGTGRIVAVPSERGFVWAGKDDEAHSCHVPDVRTWAESQPARTGAASSAIVTYSIDRLSSERTAQAQLAVNAWNIALAAAGMKTRVMQVSGNASIKFVEKSLGGLLGSSAANTMGVTVTRRKNPIGGDRLVADALIAINADNAAAYAADPMLPVQIFGHELGHALGLDDVRGGHQLMSNALRYTSESDVTRGIGPGEYAPNLCETAKLAENGLP